MSYFEKLAANSFRKIDGTIIFYPSGVFGKGRVIPSNEVKEKILKWYVHIYRFLLLVFFPYGMVIGVTQNISLITMSPFIIAAIVLGIWQLYLTKDLVIHDSKMDFKEVVNSAVTMIPNWHPWILGIASMVLAIAVTALVIIKNNYYPRDMLLASGVWVFSLLGLWLSIFIYRKKKEIKSNEISSELELIIEKKEERSKSFFAVDISYIIVFVAVIVFVIMLKLGNPYKKYSTQDFWRSAIVNTVFKVPAEALEPGNKNGGVLMWAATTVSDPAIISTLVELGADINESDVLFAGTPLSGAAGYNKNPKILRELVNLGADVDKILGNNEKALHIAASWNTNPGIIEEFRSKFG